MTRVLQINLSEAIRSCIAELSEQGYFTTHEVTTLVQSRYATLVDEYGDRLKQDGLAKMARRLMKRPMPQIVVQMSLFPEEVQQLELPQHISLLPEGVDPETELPDEEYTWIELHTASLAELHRHRALLRVNAERAQRRLLNIEQLCDFLAPVLEGERENEPIGPVLEELGRAQREVND